MLSPVPPPSSISLNPHHPLPSVSATSHPHLPDALPPVFHTVGVPLRVQAHVQRCASLHSIAPVEAPSKPYSRTVCRLVGRVPSRSPDASPECAVSSRRKQAAIDKRRRLLVLRLL